MGIPFKIEMYPWTRCLEMIKNGGAEGIFTLSKSAKREKFLTYPNEPINYSENVFFYNKKKRYHFDGTMRSLKGLMIATTLNYHYRDDFLKSNLFKHDFAAEDISGIKKIANGRDDLFICDKLVGTFLAKQEGVLSKITYLQLPLKTRKMYLAFRKNNPKNIKLIRKFDKTLKSMKKDGTYSKIIHKYLK